MSARRVDPDPSVTSAIGRHHSLLTAIADLVDNSIDAGARRILVRFIRHLGMVSGLMVVDDGAGMDSDTIDRAMAYARRRNYDASELGKFGIGMKAASLSQADLLLVWSKRYGAPHVGRGLAAESLDTGPMVQTFSAEDAQDHYQSVMAGFSRPTGTVVEWREPREFLRSTDEGEQTAWVERQVHDLRAHLGLVLHRILVREGLRVEIDVYDPHTDFRGTVKRAVEPLDPFGYRHTGLTGYPLDLPLDLPTGRAAARLVVWPADSVEPGWLLGGRPPLETQGLYVYRHDRLLQAGGWNTLAEPSVDLARARILLDVNETLEPYVTVNPEKTGVVLAPDLVAAFQRARTADGTDLRTYFTHVRDASREARRRTPRPIEVPEPGRGVFARLRDAFAENAEFIGDAPVDMRWRTLSPEHVFEVDPEQRCLWLNARYREELGGVTGGRSDDAPLTKALLFLLAGELATKAYLSGKAKRQIHAWNAVLLAAIREDTDQMRSGAATTPARRMIIGAEENSADGGER